MLIVKVEKGESIEKALKRMKKKFTQTKVVKELRDRKHFTKPSVTKRQAKLKAVYKHTKERLENN